jgi:DNA-binding response OmpR family regulator
MHKAHLLLVEDDDSLGFIIKDNLEMKGYAVDLFTDGASGWIAFKAKDYDLCILDVMLPKKDGFTLIESIRKRNLQVPVLFLTAKIAQKDRLEGFKKGGDDYITKPFAIEELIYRVEVFLKRSRNGNTAQDIFQNGSYTIDFSNLILERAEKQITLTQMEADLLKLFCMNREQLIKRNVILKSVWGSDDYFLGRSLDVFISKLRKYLKDDNSIEIVNQFGIGFRMAEKKK